MSCLDSLGLSGPQRAAIEDPSHRVLVSAGAGSGKTTLLVAYFVYALIDAQVPPQDLVAVTFTRKAAAELAARIRAQLNACGREDLARSVEFSTIGTIHSLCRRLIKGRALEAGVDPAFSVLESDTATIVKQEVLERIWSEAVEAADESRLAVLAMHQSLRGAVIPAYDDLRARGEQEPQLSIPAATEPEAAQAQVVRVVQDALAVARSSAKRGKSLESNMCRLEACLERLSSAAAKTSSPVSDPVTAAAETRAAEAFFPDRMVRSMEAEFAPVRTALTEYRLCLAGIQAQPLVEAMNDLLGRFHRAYTCAKREEGALDFADLELHASILVRERGCESAPFFGPQARVLVDEFQDTNELQCTILENLGAADLLMVGDENQSLYRFRGADVEVFRRREEALRAISAVEGCGGGEGHSGSAASSGLHRLVDNYRSSEHILAFVDRLFETPSFFGGRFARLKHARREETLTAQPRRAVDIVFVERTDAMDPESAALSIGEAESLATAAQIRGLLDDEGWQPRDIAVLLPALTHAGLVQEALARLDIESYLVRGKGYYSREEVADIRALLRSLLNPHDDLAMVTVLRSPMVGLSDNGLFLLGKEARLRGSSLWQVIDAGAIPHLEEPDVAALGALAAALQALRIRVGRPGLAAFLDDAISEFGYDLCALASDEGDRRFANIRKLMRMADDYECLHGPHLAGFVDLLEGLGGLSDSEGSAPTLAEGENVVRIMTVHQAKGLEFPVVVLAGLGTEGRQDGVPQFALSENGDTAVFFKGTRSRYEEADLCWGPGAEIMSARRSKDEAEGLRILYVAMTRAEDRLVVVGARGRSNRPEGCHINRILHGLGFDSFPQPGDSIELEGVDARVQCVDPADVAAVFEGPRASSALETAAGRPDSHVGIPACPPFLAPVSAAVLPRSLSYSAISAFRDCPRRFYLERVLGLRADGAVSERAVSPPRDDDGADDEHLTTSEDAVLDDDERNAGRDVGLLVHGLLERSDVTGPAPSRDEVRRVAIDLVRQGMPALGFDAVERALDLALAFWRSPVVLRKGLSSARKEVPFSFSQGGMIVSGVMDLVWRDGESWFVVDYKTNSLAGRSAAEAVRSYELQACVYGLAALRAGARHVSMSFLFLEQPDLPVEHSFSVGDRNVLEAKMETVLGEIRDGDFASCGGKACARCRFERLCAGLICSPHSVDEGDGSSRNDGIQ